MCFGRPAPGIAPDPEHFPRVYWTAWNPIVASSPGSLRDFDFFLRFASWCAISGRLHRIGKTCCRDRSGPQEDDLAGLIDENTHDEPP